MAVAPPSFGIELEFFLLDNDDFPALGATQRVIDRWLLRGYEKPPVPELSSFQIELNPGPWPLTPRGLEAALLECEQLIQRLDECAYLEGTRLSSLGLIPKITDQHIQDKDYFSADPKLAASSRHFKNRHAIAEFEDGSTFVFPGESVVGCINEIHIHVRHANDERTLDYFNYLNRARDAVWSVFKTPLVLNEKYLRSGFDTMYLFAQANGEMNPAGNLCRIGYLPTDITSMEQYLALAASFTPIVVDDSTNATMPIEQAVWFWVRLRGPSGSLRVEYRPTEMGPNWRVRVQHLFADAYRFSTLETGELNHSEPPRAA
jgi:hypothetical protein